MYVLTCVTGDLEKVSELISGLALGPEEESPYEALFEATSCHSLDSLTSGKSSDRDSGRPDSEAGKVSSSLTETHPHPHTQTFRQKWQTCHRRWNAELPLEGDSGPLATWLGLKPLQYCTSCVTECVCNAFLNLQLRNDGCICNCIFIRCYIPDHLQKDRLVHSSHPGPGHEEEVSSKVTEAGRNMLPSNTTDSHVSVFIKVHMRLIAE